MVKHTQTIRRPIADELLECDHFVGLALKELKTIPNGNTNRTPTLNNKITTKWTLSQPVLKFSENSFKTILDLCRFLQSS